MRPVPQADSTVFGTRTRTTPIQQVTIAVDEQDVPTVTEAIAAGLTIQCVARSGVPSGEDLNPAPEGMVRVPVSCRAIPAHFRIAHSDLVDPRTREQRYIHLPQTGLEQRGVILEPTELLGRVLREDKPAGEIFLREELSPLGTPEGLAGALPEGRRSFTLSAAQLEGAALLRRGDRIDIMASISLQLPQSVRTFQSLNSGRRQIRVIVQDALVLAPAGAPETIAAGGGEAKREIILGIQPAEVPILEQALNLNSGLRAIFRSRQDSEPAQATRTDRAVKFSQVQDSDRIPDPGSIPSLDPLAEATLLVTQVGQERETWLFYPEGLDALGAPLPLDAFEVPPSAATTNPRVPTSPAAVTPAQRLVANQATSADEQE
jgi:Flp pilus assembly protein CpaB